MTREKDITFLRNNLAYLYHIYITYRELGRYKELLGPDVWQVLNSSLKRNFLLGVASLLDPVTDSQGNRNISIRIIERIDLAPHAEAIAKIMTFRRKGIAHNDQKSMHRGDEFFDSYNLTYAEVESLFTCLIRALEEETHSVLPQAEIDKKITSKLEEVLGGK